MYRYLIVVAVLLLAGIGIYRWLALTDSEITDRIELAIPFETQATIDQSEVSSNCVAAAFNLADSGDFDAERSEGRPELAHDLGRTWHKSSSMDAYVDSLDDEYLQRYAKRTIADAKRCVAQLELEEDFFQDAPVLISHSHTARQFVVVFQDTGNSGWYFAQGR